ncbi:ACT domain-containing protein [Sulfitobacter sp. F26169L]|uniref:ACT domain-containing protein n=1 Tax=Sulfitobacter sp. F26169L TaxID=2996015 RepID=UPI002260AB50|nr:ACT domain-containing protein [Sulfitobacter sp. F26169L]MCX7566336.1 ACT domain-containing protein [Sulfitobacter sp. F26169L]
MSQAVKDTRAMISGMAPLLDETVYHFCTAPEELLPQALASFREDEGLSLILSEDVAAEHGLQSALPMMRITFTVHSALDGVGLTAAVAGELARAGIACNMVAGAHHDHAFVPAQDAARAVALLSALAEAT